MINTNPNSLDQIKSKHNKFEENIGNIYKQLIDPEFQKQNNISDKDILKELQKLYNQIPTANIFIVKNIFAVGILFYIKPLFESFHINYILNII